MEKNNSAEGVRQSRNNPGELDKSGDQLQCVGQVNSEPLSREQLRISNRPYWQSLARVFGRSFATRRLESYLNDVDLEAQSARARGHKIRILKV